MNENTELVRQAKEGDAHAFAQLYAMIYQDLYRFAACTLKHPQDAEDAVSEAVADAFAGIGGLREAAAFRGWMFRILTAKCKRHLRQYAEQICTPWEETDSPAGQEGGTAALDTGDALDPAERLDVRQAFDALPDPDRLILSLNLFAGYSSQEIGELLGMNANTVRSRQSRALRRMEAQLSDK